MEEGTARREVPVLVRSLLLAALLAACAPEEEDPPPGDSKPGETSDDTGAIDDTSSADDTGDTEADDTHSADDTGETSETGDAPEAAGDLTAVGPWTPAASLSVSENRDGDTLYLTAWFPTDAGAEADPYIYGWDGYSFEGAARATEPSCDEARPVMVHSHGNTSLGWEMFWFQEFAASHGWLSVAPDHPGNTFYDYSHPLGALTTQRPADIEDTYDWLLAQSADPSSPLYGCVDPAAGYVATGYSFGGYTAYATAGALVDGPAGPASLDLSDPRVTAVVTFAPWDAWGALTTGTSALTVPALTLGAERDATVGTQFRDLYGHVVSTPRAMGAFTNAGHLSYVPIYCWWEGDGCGADYIATDDFTERARTAVMAFVEHHRGLTGAIEQLPPADAELSWDVTLE